MNLEFLENVTFHAVLGFTKDIKKLRVLKLEHQVLSDLKKLNEDYDLEILKKDYLYQILFGIFMVNYSLF